MINTRKLQTKENNDKEGATYRCFVVIKILGRTANNAGLKARGFSRIAKNTDTIFIQLR